ncbi:MAG TPA: DUF309 domain-containing protein [Anaerolineae bacterium]|nr:DUF309 domain-containing protein [Anaerolineae bacterium]
MTKNNNDQPIIVAFVADLFFSTRIDKVAQHLNYTVHWIENEAQFQQADDPAPANPRPGESISGPTHRLMDQLTQWQPALLIFDLSAQEIPWRRWLPRLKSSPATRRIPVLAFGAHVDTETFAEARSLGADSVVARSRFSTGMLDLIQNLANPTDHQALFDTCQQPLSDLAKKGIEAYNAGQFYDAHEHLEHAWQEDSSVGRELYRGILQVAVAYYQISRGNYRGAVKMCLRARQWLDPLPDQCRTINIAQLRQEFETNYQTITDLGPDNLDKFDLSTIQPIPIVP